MTEYEINTFKIDLKSITMIEEVDMWLEKLSKVVNGIVVQGKKEIKKDISKRAMARVWTWIDPLLDKRLEFMQKEKMTAGLTRKTVQNYMSLN